MKNKQNEFQQRPLQCIVTEIKCHLVYSALLMQYQCYKEGCTDLLIDYGDVGGKQIPAETPPSCILQYGFGFDDHFIQKCRFGTAKTTYFLARHVINFSFLQTKDYAVAMTAVKNLLFFV